MDATTATELLQIAARVRRLPGADAAAAIEAVVRRRCPSAFAPPQWSLPAKPARSVEPSYIVVGRRRIMVQARRPSFALG